jgi:hypothetical protein
MLAGLHTGVVHDRKLMREAQVNSSSAGSSAMACMRNCGIIRV